ncbi:MAG TPA: alpha/beta fold hydrolase [Polyangiaceae bacterium]|nr:alpha/beta fold hydrolase [Polyangiaceae bacterium]
MRLLSSSQAEPAVCAGYWGYQLPGAPASRRARDPSLRPAAIEWKAFKRSGEELSVQQNRLSQSDPLVGILCRYALNGRPNTSADPVLLVHGATAWRGTFLQPDGGLVRYLLQNFDVWTLDWRCSKVITDAWLAEPGERVPEPVVKMTLDEVAALELPAAVAQLAAATDRVPHVLGHCMGAAAAALAAARGAIAPAARASESSPAVRSLMLSAIGLFFRGGVDTWLRAQERLDAVQQPTWYLSPSAERWPDDYEQVYALWSKTPYPHCDRSFCRRISSLLGAPYRPDEIGYLHDDDLHGLPSQFGAMPLSFLGHCARSVRRGFPPGSYDPARFEGLRVHLLTGNENQLWHRDSIDRMYDWLRRDRRVQVTKRVFERYGHQDLWWNPRSLDPGGVYEYVADLLARS